VEKECKKCLTIKNIEEFAKNRNTSLNVCKTCNNLKQRQEWSESKEQKAIERSARRLRNIEKYRTKEASYRKKYRLENKERVNENMRTYMKEYRKKRPEFRMQKRISYIIKCSLDETSTTTHMIFQKLGYTPQQLKEHIQSKFLDGMSWDNYGEWHIDHIVPQSWLPFVSLEDENFIKCWSLHNLQPLWAFDNISKGNRFAG